MATMREFSYERPMPTMLRLMGGRFMDGPRDCRTRWGSVQWGRWAPALMLGLFEEGFSLHGQFLGLGVWLKLPFLRRFAWEPHEIMEKWGCSVVDGAIHFGWGRHYKIVDLPFTRWQRVSHDVRRIDGSWVPFVGSWEQRQPHRLDGKEPDGRHLETYPYRYLLRSGEVQTREATIHVEREVRRLNWTPLTRMRFYIDVQFSDEVGERSGSWKGGTIGCAYEMRPGETPRQCLKRMEQERRF